MSDDDSSAASSATPDLSNVDISEVPLVASIKKKFEEDIRKCVHYGVDFSQFQGKSTRDLKKSDFINAWKSAKGVESDERRTTSRANAGRLLEALSRCDQCAACRSMKEPPPNCGCSRCRNPNTTSSCVVVQRALEQQPKCETWGRGRSPLAAIEAGESASVRVGDPRTAETLKLSTIIVRIRGGEKAAGNHASEEREHAAAVFRVAAPGMPRFKHDVIAKIGADATNGDLAEYVAAHLEEVCANLEEDGYLDTDQLAELQHLVRAAAAKPDLLATTVRCERCDACLRLQAAKDATYYSQTKRKKQLALAHKYNPCPPENRIPEPQLDSIRQERTWERIAKDLYAYLRRQILALGEGSLAEATWIRNRARVAVETRRERGRITGALADWRPGRDAALRARRQNVWGEGSKGVIYNNCQKHRSARWAELGDENALVRFAFPDDVPYLRET